MLLHQTDLFRPHNDPDDHWDLACAFALAKTGLCPLAGVLIDFPPGPPVLNHRSNPDLGAVAQLGYLTGIHVPLAVGNPTYYSGRNSDGSGLVPPGVDFVLQTLRQSPVPVAISVVGSSRDIADAIAREPALFAEKCKALYLVVGSGCPEPERVKSLEWNVALDPAAYAQIFSAACPIYWVPCLEDEDRVASPESRQYASHYRFLQSEILDYLPEGLRRYFAFMYEKRESSFWLYALEESFTEVLAAERGRHRMMYSTPLFFDVAGLGVTTTGEIRPKIEPRNDWVYGFKSVNVDCNAAGETRWTPTSRPTNRMLFHVLDIDAYPTAMTRAMRDLLVNAFGPSDFIRPVQQSSEGRILLPS